MVVRLGRSAINQGGIRKGGASGDEALGKITAGKLNRRQPQSEQGNSGCG
ncbi:hypothetical protein N9X53_01420 [Mariniblastus sp.]|nr:hypothetical protein [Mariniblastus sp.]